MPCPVTFIFVLFSILCFPVSSLPLADVACFIHCVFDKQLLRPGPHVITMIPVGTVLLHHSLQLWLGSCQLRNEGFSATTGLFASEAECWMAGGPRSCLFACSCWKSRKSLIGNQGWWWEKSSQGPTGLPSKWAQVCSEDGDTWECFCSLSDCGRASYCHRSPPHLYNPDHS